MHTNFFDCPWKTSRTYKAPKANPNTLFVSLIQYLQGSSPPSDPKSAFRSPLYASRKTFDK